MQQQMVCNNILDCTWLLYDRSVGCCAAHSSLIDLYLSAINQLAVSHTVGKNGCTQKWLLCGTAEGNSKGNGTRSTLPHLTRAALASMQCDCCWRVLFPFCLLSSKNCGSDVRRDAIIPPPSDLFYFLWPTFRVSMTTIDYLYYLRPTGWRRCGCFFFFWKVSYLFYHFPDREMMRPLWRRRIMHRKRISSSIWIKLNLNLNKILSRMGNWLEPCTL